MAALEAARGGGGRREPPAPCGLFYGGCDGSAVCALITPPRRSTSGRVLLGRASTLREVAMRGRAVARHARYLRRDAVSSFPDMGLPYGSPGYVCFIMLAVSFRLRDDVSLGSALWEGGPRRRAVAGLDLRGIAVPGFYGAAPLERSRAAPRCMAASRARRVVRVPASAPDACLSRRGFSRSAASRFVRVAGVVPDACLSPPLS